MTTSGTLSLYDRALSLSSPSPLLLTYQKSLLRLVAAHSEPMTQTERGKNRFLFVSAKSCSPGL